MSSDFDAPTVGFARYVEVTRILAEKVLLMNQCQVIDKRLERLLDPSKIEREAFLEAAKTLSVTESHEKETVKS